MAQIIILHSSGEDPRLGELAVRGSMGVVHTPSTRWLRNPRPNHLRKCYRRPLRRMGEPQAPHGWSPRRVKNSD